MNKRFLILSFIVLLYAFVPWVHVSADENDATDTSKELDIELSPNDYLFQVQNMKPGDWAPRDLIISNNGIQDFDYQIELRNTREEEKLFNELIIEVGNGEEQLYKGNLPDFTLSERSLASGEEEDLTFTVYFPEHLGNDFQGLETEFILIVTAEGEDQQDVISVGGNVSNGDGNGTTTDRNGAALPDTATNIFTLLLIGTILLSVGGGILFIRKVQSIKDQRI